MTERFMEIDGIMSEIRGQEGEICFTQRDQWNKRDQENNHITKNSEMMDLGGKCLNNEAVIIDAKRKRLEDVDFMDNQEVEIFPDNTKINGPKNLLEVGPRLEARLE